ncbi:MAG: PAS domain-containing protein [Opitutae bacterium]|nr:PAS domain-containing protein [Opitutae bacterium]
MTASRSPAPLSSRFRPRDTLRLRLALFSLALLLPLLALIALGIRKKFVDDRAAAAERLHVQRVIAEQALNNYLELLRRNLTELESIVGFADLSSPTAHEQCRQFLRLHPEFINIAVVDRTGTLRFSTAFPIANPPQNYRAMPTVAEQLGTTAFNLSAAARGLTTGRWGCVAALPLRRDPDLLLSAPIDLKALSKLLFFGPDTVEQIVTVVDLHNTVVLSSYTPETRIGEIRPSGSLVRERLAAGANTGEFAGVDGVRRTYDAAAITLADWTLTVAVPTDSVYAAAWKDARNSILAVALVLFAGLLLIRLYSQHLLRPVFALANAARDHAAGQRERLAPIKGPEEIADTARAFNDMVRARDRAEAGLVESELRYRTIVEQTGQMVYDIDIATGRIQWFGDDAIANITGDTPEAFAAVDGDAWVERLHPDDRAGVLGLYERCLATAEPFITEYRFRHRDGSYRFIEDYGVILRDPAGQPVRMLGRMSDITARHRAETAFRENEDRHRLVTEQTGQLIYDLDMRTRQVRWFGSAAAQQILGCSPEEMSRLGVDGWAARLHPDDRAAAIARLEHSMVTGAPCQAEYRLRHRDGSYRLVEERGAVLSKPDGAFYRMVGRMTDITDRKRVEAERTQIEKKLLETQKLESLGVLAGGIAHDFNNLLTGVLGNAGLARLELPADAAAREQIDQIERAAQRAADLCKQMLAYSGKGRFVVQALDLNELIEDSLGLLAVSISKKAILRFNPGAQLPSIQADTTQLRQIVMNLVINASEALEDRTGQITLNTGALVIDETYLATAQFTGDLAPGPAVFLEISDTGSGMSRETLARIFDPFFTTKFTGRGLGLAAVLGIVRGHKGAIKVYSERGAGTTFRLLFPATRDAAQPLARPAPERPAWRGSGCVLVIDDEEAVRHVAAGILRALGFDADSASDGAVGIVRFSSAPTRYVAVLLDLTMPHVDGEETFRQLRLLRPDVKVILMSGFNRVDAVNRFVGKGLAGFIQKPFQVETLASELRRVIDEMPKAN